MKKQQNIMFKSWKHINISVDPIDTKVLLEIDESKDRFPNKNSSKADYKTKSERKNMDSTEANSSNLHPPNLKMFQHFFVQQTEQENHVQNDPSISKKTVTTSDTEHKTHINIHSLTNCSGSCNKRTEISDKNTWNQKILEPNQMYVEDLCQHNLLEPFLKLQSNDFSSMFGGKYDEWNSFEDESENASPLKNLATDKLKNESLEVFNTKEFVFPGMEIELNEDALEQTEINEEKQFEIQKNPPLFKSSKQNSEHTSNSKTGITSCNCKKSKCLKLYCECFRSNGFCDASCSCQECYNKAEYRDIRNQFYVEQLQRNPSSFSSKIVALSTTTLYSKGCNCKKTECMKNYCECYAAKVKCTHLCRCTECQNFDEKIPQESLQCFQDRQVKKRKKSEKNFNECLTERLASRKGTLEIGDNSPMK